MSRVINIVRRQWADNPNDPPPVVVVSAMSKVTDRLVETGRLAADGQGDQAAQIIADLLTRHLGVASTLVQGAALDELNAQLTSDFNALEADVRRWAVQHEVTPAASDVDPGDRRTRQQPHRRRCVPAAGGRMPPGSIRGRCSSPTRSTQRRSRTWTPPRNA